LTQDPVTIGVVGGGQLCRMLCEAASPLGFEVVFVDPTPNAPARPVARDQIVADFDDPDANRQLVDRADVVTYDIELADPAVIEAIDPDVPVHPSPSTLRTIQDKLDQNAALVDEDIPVPAYRAVETDDDVHRAGDELGYPLMLKAREGGYDGRGNVRVDEPDDAGEVFAQLDGPLMAETFVDYERELSVIGVRGEHQHGVYPVTETVHEEQILRHTITPARTSPEMREEAREVAFEVLGAMQGRGVFGIELFEADGEILVNEIAPRPHNSGHWTIEGAHTPQFENHARAIAGLPLGSTSLRDPTVSVNVLGVHGPREVTLAGVDKLLTDDAHLHWYGKREERSLRKLGHVTYTGEDVDELLPHVDQVHDTLRFEP
jgi:5-(carboxyamino)imidazole ribonucleotide synthase